jgi:alginate O-acetyltransferase complex protein AlgI
MLFITPDVIAVVNKFLPEDVELKESFRIALPLGISFYTFQAMSYLIDVQRKKVAASSSFIDFACYLHMFPQLVAGPIVRYSQVAEELKQRNLNIDRFINGSARFTIGLAKKMLIADTLGKVADAAFSVSFGELSAFGAWAGIICYTFQIYFDFSGYSDMAIGMGMMLGFSFPENFNYPYIANSIKNFWQRWHISLSTWFRDYLYIPLGGNRKSNYRTYLNLFIVFLLCGFWHGANWTFMAWGAYYGLFLVFERKFPSFIDKLPSAVRHVYVVIVVIFGWVLFRSDSFAHALYYIKSMFGAFEGGIQMNRVWMVWYGHDVKIALFMGFLFSFPLVPLCRNAVERISSNAHAGISLTIDFMRYTYLLALLLICMMPLFGATYNAFIYFRF